MDEWRRRQGRSVQVALCSPLAQAARKSVLKTERIHGWCRATILLRLNTLCFCSDPCACKSGQFCVQTCPVGAAAPSGQDVACDLQTCTDGIQACAHTDRTCTHTHTLLLAAGRSAHVERRPEFPCTPGRTSEEEVHRDGSALCTSTATSGPKLQQACS